MQRVKVHPAVVRACQRSNDASRQRLVRALLLSAAKNPEGEPKMRTHTKGALLGMALLLGAATQVNAVVLLEEGFDDVEALFTAGWLNVNNSTPGGETSWFQGNTGVFDAQGGAADSYAAANYLVAPSGGTADLWLLSPELLLNDGDVISFWTRTAPDAGWGDAMRIGLYGSSPWLDINPGNAPDGFPTDWTQYSVTVSGLGGETLTRFGFNYVGAADFLNYIGLDTLSVDREASPVPEPGTMMLMGAGLVAFALAWRRKRVLAATLAAGLALPALAADPPKPPAAPLASEAPSAETGSRVAIDPATGALRPVTAEEAKKLDEMARAAKRTRTPAPPARSATADEEASQEPAVGVPFTAPDGTVGVKLGEEHAVYSVASVGADGKVTMHCVTGKANAEKEVGHEHR